MVCRTEIAIPDAKLRMQGIVNLTAREARSVLLIENVTHEPVLRNGMSLR